MKTKEELVTQTYLNKSEIETLFDQTFARAKRTYQLAEKIDDDYFGDYRIEPHRVRLSSAAKVNGTTVEQLILQIKSGLPHKDTA